MKKIFVLICMLFGLVLPAYSEGAAVLPAERGAVENIKYIDMDNIYDITLNREIKITILQ